MVDNNSSKKDIFDKFLEKRCTSIDSKDWIKDYNKKKCPECYSIHSESADFCSTCGWNK